MIHITIDIYFPWREGTFGYQVIRQLAWWMRGPWLSVWVLQFPFCVNVAPTPSSALYDLDGNEIEHERVSEVDKC